MRPPPPKLSREEFARRCQQLRAEGKPLTMRNVDPEFTRWADSCSRLRAMGAVVLIVGSVVFGGMLALWALQL